MSEGPETTSKTYKNRTDFELDVQVMRARGWVLDSVGDRKVFIDSGSPLILTYLNAPTRITVHYRRA